MSRPVVGKLPLELGDASLDAGDLRLPGARARSECAASGRDFATRGGSLRPRRLGLDRRARRLPLALQVGPAAVVRAQRAVLERDDAVGHGVQERAVVGDEEDRPGERLERGLECLARSRRRGGSSARRGRGSSTPDATSSASASRRRSPPESAVTGRSCVSQPEKRNRPSSVCARGRGSPVAAAVASSTDPLVGSSMRVLGEVAGHDSVAESDLPAVERVAVEDRGEERRLARAVRPDEADLLAALDHDRRVVEQSLVARRERDVVGLEDDAAGSVAGRGSRSRAFAGAS